MRRAINDRHTRSSHNSTAASVLHRQRRCRQDAARACKRCPDTAYDPYVLRHLQDGNAHKKLKELPAIPPALGDLVDVIKDEGDEAVHEDELYDKESAEALQGLTETFLEQTFTIPTRIAQVRGKKK
jgi:hypothetical protein